MPKATDTHQNGVQPAGSDYELSKSEVFELLSADRRQAVLLHLDTIDGVAKLGELAEHIASKECNCTPAELSSQQRKRAYVGLYQCHLPKMADAGVIDYDSDRGTVELTDRSARLLKYLYFEEDDESEEAESILGRLLG